jgi:antitoxin component YwqK of YwqJK toxin-antitoxin module
MINRITLLLFLSVGLSQNEYNDRDIIQMDNGLWTVKFSDELITGLVYDYFGENNKKVYIGNLRNGKKEGNWTWWYENGQMKFNNTFKEGKENGLFTSWYENGQDIKIKENQFVNLLKYQKRNLKGLR